MKAKVKTRKFRLFVSTVNIASLKYCRGPKPQSYYSIFQNMKIVKKIILWPNDSGL